MNRVLLKSPLQLGLKNNVTNRHLCLGRSFLRLTKVFSTVTLTL